MSAPAAEPRPDGLPAADADAPVLDVVIPVYNEEVDLAGVGRPGCTSTCAPLPWTFRITIADNASTDGTALVAHRLSPRATTRCAAVHLAGEGPRPGAQAGVVARRTREVLVYMDVDLSTDLERAAAAGRAAAVGPLRPGDRHAG